jgi:excinuclease ABC subunit C
VAVGIAKKEEVIFTRERPEPIVLPENDTALLLIQRIRDEAHRFAITFHRKARSMRDLRSELDEVPGIGPRRRQALLRAFGSLAGVRRATRESSSRSSARRRRTRSSTTSRDRTDDRRIRGDGCCAPRNPAHYHQPPTTNHELPTTN